MYSFKKQEHLKSRKLIESLFSKGSYISEYPVKLIWIKENLSCNNVPLQAAFSVSKKKYKKAVDRNKLKRLMREAFRLNKLNITTWLIENNIQISFMLIYTGSEIEKFNLIQAKIIKLLNRLETLLKNSTDN